MGGAPKGYDTAGYRKDIAVFKSFLAEHSAKTILLGPGSVGEGGVLSMPGPDIMPRVISFQPQAPLLMHSRFTFTRLSPIVAPT